MNQDFGNIRTEFLFLNISILLLIGYLKHEAFYGVKYQIKAPSGNMELSSVIQSHIGGWSLGMEKETGKVTLQVGPRLL